MVSNKETSGINTVNGEDRLLWADGLRTWLALSVFFLHVCTEFSVKWGILDQILYGFTGKYAVAFFAIMLGFFAHRPGSTSSDLSVKILRRYIQFSLPLLFVTGTSAIIYVALKINGTDAFDAAIQVAKESFLFGTNVYCEQAWCIRDFFIASIIVYVLTNKQNRCMLFALLYTVLTLIGETWVAICLLGALIKEAYIFVENTKVIGRHKILFTVIKILSLLFSFLIIRFEESDLTYLYNGISAAIVFWVLLNSSILKKVFSIIILTACSKYSFELFLVHLTVCYILRPLIMYSLQNVIPHNVLVWISILVIFIVSAVLSVLLSLVTKKISKSLDSYVTSLARAHQKPTSKA